MSLNPSFSIKGFTFTELFHADGLNRLDQLFLQKLQTQHPELHGKLLSYREQNSQLNAIEISELLIACGIFLEHFLADLFNIEEAVAISQAKTTAFNPLSAFKKYFILRRAKKELSKVNALPSFAELNSWLENQLKQASLQTDDKELAIALLGMQYLAKPEVYAKEIDNLVYWCTRSLTSPEGQQLVAQWVSFQIPKRVDYENLVRTVSIANDPHDRVAADDSEIRLRDGFALTDPRMNSRQVQDEINYCIYCHDHEGDFCSKGFPVKKGDPTQGFKKNPLDVTLTGCPLDEKISEMHSLKRDGFTIAALAMVMVDNPMCPATGHRICNECMKACIYQKQDPVNIPQIETRVLTDVLDLPWGIEIYDLLTRWNPLRQTQWVMKPYNSLKVMIAGMGPAGFTLAHHLLLEGFAVVGLDGLKIEPLPQHLIDQPIYQFETLKEALDERLMAGFGGVAEYGITVRWDKNFLKLIYLSLVRKPYFQVFGGVRFGGTISVEDAWELGFDHFVVAVGAGLPKALPIPGSLAPGMRQANDFLMALQLGNAAKSSSLNNLQIRLPAVIIGGGLTGVDAATEVQAYYITQVEKILHRYEVLAQKHNEKFILRQLDLASKEILAEFLQHGRAVREERQLAKKTGRQPNFIKLIREWGGVTIAYRRSLQESPAYINNHEELKKALEEGIYYKEALEPIAVELDEFGHSKALICHRRERRTDNNWVTTEEEVRLPAHSILAATGTQPNTAYEFEHRGTFNRIHLQYQHYEDVNGDLTAAHGVENCKDPQFGPFTSYRKDHRRVSLIGDTHPVFHGSVVRAIASGMRTYPKILTILQNKLQQQGDEKEYQQFVQQMQHLFTAQVQHIIRRTNNIVEIAIQAPFAAKHFKPGHFYRLQNFETLAPSIEHTLLQMEPVAVVAAECDAQGILTFLVTENTAATSLCSLLKVGEPVSLMGPTGVRAKIPTAHETILIIGNSNSFAFARSYGSALRKAGNHVIYLCHYQHPDEIYSQEKLEQAADVIIWSTKQNDALSSYRTNDYSITNTSMIAALCDYAEGKIRGNLPAIPLHDVDKIYVVGDPPLLREFQHARTSILKKYLTKDPNVFGSVYGNMQCMLKGVCAQCLQWQIDPETGQRTKAVFACSWQDQPLEIIDIDHIDARLAQNHLHEKINKLWVDYLFAENNVIRV